MIPARDILMAAATLWAAGGLTLATHGHIIRDQASDQLDDDTVWDLFGELAGEVRRRSQLPTPAAAPATGPQVAVLNAYREFDARIGELLHHLIHGKPLDDELLAVASAAGVNTTPPALTLVPRPQEG
jgi:hypothetical protein